MFPPNPCHIKRWLTGLNSENTPKVLFHGERVAEQTDDKTSIPPNPTRNKPAIKREKKKMPIKGGEVQQEEGFIKI